MYHSYICLLYPEVIDEIVAIKKDKKLENRNKGNRTIGLDK